MEKKNCIGQCPYCWSDYVEYGSSWLEEDCMYYECVCEDCSKSFKEWYSVEYIHTECEEE